MIYVLEPAVQGCTFWTALLSVWVLLPVLVTATAAHLRQEPRARNVNVKAGLPEG